MTDPTPGYYLPAQFAIGPDGQTPFRAHFEEIINSYAIAGATQLRLGFDWSQLQPRAGGLDGKWVEWDENGQIIAQENYSEGKLK